ncbi:MAG TPA: hypothetical protein VLC10_00215 [Patescibacteria group bacterium]|nr:hypothetical protein [Patescibacteria group bacterium]
MFFYTQGDAFNAIASVSELETGALLLGQPAAPLNPEYGRWDDYGGAVARAMETGGRIHVTVEPDGIRPPLGGWRGALDAAPEPWRSAVADALAFFARRYGRTLDRSKVEVIGLGGSKAESRE